MGTASNPLRPPRLLELDRAVDDADADGGDRGYLQRESEAGQSDLIREAADES